MSDDTLVTNAVVDPVDIVDKFWGRKITLPFCNTQPGVNLLMGWGCTTMWNFIIKEKTFPNLFLSVLMGLTLMIYATIRYIEGMLISASTLLLLKKLINIYIEYQLSTNSERKFNPLGDIGHTCQQSSAGGSQTGSCWRKRWSRSRVSIPLVCISFQVWWWNTWECIVLINPMIIKQPLEYMPTNFHRRLIG